MLGVRAADSLERDEQVRRLRRCDPSVLSFDGV